MLFQYFYIDFKICKLIFHCRFYSCYVINIKSFPWNRIIRQYHELIHFKWEIRGNISFLENQLSSTNNWFLNQQQSLTIKRLMTDDAHKMSFRFYEDWIWMSCIQRYEVMLLDIFNIWCYIMLDFTRLWYYGNYIIAHFQIKQVLHFYSTPKMNAKRTELFCFIVFLH